MAGSSGGPIGAGSEATGDAPSSAGEGLPAATQQATPVAASMT